MELDKSYLDTRIFTAFAETSRHQYVYICNMQTNVSHWSRSAVEYLGLPDEYMLGADKIWLEHIHPDDRDTFIQDLRMVFNGDKKYHQVEYRALNKEGNYVLCTCRGLILKGDNGEPDIFAGTIVNHGIMDDIDPNTGLYNIYEFFNSVRKALKQKTPIGVIKIGINRFSEINDIYGYVFGNALLNKFAAKAKDYLSGRGIAYRMDGVKFAFVGQEIDRSTALTIYNDIQEIAKNDITVGDINVALDISGGCAIIESFNINEHSVLACVTYALEQSKHNKHGELVFVDNNFDDTSKKQLELMSAIRQSVIKDCAGFYLCYQPLVRDVDGKIIGMEALLRWHNDTYGEVSPGAFIPWLENDTCFFELGNWILLQAMTDGKKIVEEFPHFIINVNISYSQLERSAFRESVLDILRQTGFPPQNLCIELTERCRNLNTDFLKDELMFFRSHGIKIALDDFGTGASSFNLLRELPVDCLKIDQTFISNIEASETDQTIVESVIACANKLGIKICIEGIENKQINDFVKKYKADNHQGYFYSRPIKIDKFIKML